MSEPAPAVVGIFVGGRSSRYGGVPKGLLTAPTGTQSIVTRLASMARGLGLDVVLVGEHAAYAGVGIPMLPDPPGASGPLGGLAALIEYAGERSAVAIACDMPHVTPALLARLMAAPPAAIVAPKREGRWEPLFARYDAARCREPVRNALAAGRHALKSLLDEVGAQVLELAPDEARLLHDWDSPEDRSRDAGAGAEAGKEPGSGGEHPRTRIEQGPLSVDEVVRAVGHPSAGAIDVFIGIVRDHAEGRVIEALEYSAYVPMAEREMASIARGVEARHEGVRVAAVHRIGALRVGDVAVVCAASAPHRDEAFVACREVIEEIKQRVPIWKRETGPGGSAWVGWVDVRPSG